MVGSLSLDGLGKPNTKRPQTLVTGVGKMGRARINETKYLLSDKELVDLYKQHIAKGSDWKKFVAACKTAAKDTNEQGLRLRLGKWANKYEGFEKFPGQNTGPRKVTKMSDEELGSLLGLKLKPAGETKSKKA